ncbi:hypothetical protein ACFVYJ_12930 [Pontibacter sp. JAM-7]|uniref:hypothetical protein n=1 Tax=Pontibacter sp. JAM-7 TaxID=3366581 RepID=UPI003AF46124
MKHQQGYRAGIFIALLSLVLAGCSDSSDDSTADQHHMFEQQQQALEKAKTVQETLDQAYKTQQQEFNKQH